MSSGRVVVCTSTNLVCWKRRGAAMAHLFLRPSVRAISRSLVWGIVTKCPDRALLRGVTPKRG